MSDSAPLLEVARITSGYGGPQVLRGIELQLFRREGLLLLGPNGAGKSTLLRILAGLQKPSAGEVRVFGQRFRPEDPSHRGQIGFVSHESLLYHGLSGRENLEFTAELFGLVNARARIDEALARVGMEWVPNRPVRTYSRGMLQRLTLARALLHRPAILLLDEPMTGLDPAGRKQLEALLVDLREAGAGILMTTHELAYVRPIATRVAFLKGGRVVDGGSVEEFPVEKLEARFLELYAARAEAGASDGRGGPRS